MRGNIDVPPLDQASGLSAPATIDERSVNVRAAACWYSHAPPCSELPRRERTRQHCSPPPHTLRPYASTARTALVSILLARTPQHSSSRPPPPACRAQEGIRRVEDGDSRTLEAAGQAYGRSGKAPKAHVQLSTPNSSICQLWCAIALGALVRGAPLANVGRIPPSPRRRSDILRV